MSVPFRFEGDGSLGVITAEKQFFTGKCILDVSAEVSCLYHVSYDARSNPEAIIIKISPKDENRRLMEADLRDFMNKLIATNHKVIRYPISGYWLDIGQHDELARAREMVKHLR